MQLQQHTVSCWQWLQPLQHSGFHVYLSQSYRTAVVDLSHVSLRRMMPSDPGKEYSLKKHMNK